MESSCINHNPMEQGRHKTARWVSAKFSNSFSEILLRGAFISQLDCGWNVGSSLVYSIAPAWLSNVRNYNPVSVLTADFKH